MCRHLAYLGPPTALSDLLFDAPHALAGRPSARACRPRARATPTGGAWRGTSTAPPRRTGTAPSPRSGTTAPSPTAPTTCAAARSSPLPVWRRPARAWSTPGTPRSSPTAGRSRSTASCTGSPTASATRSAARVRADRLASVVGDADTEVLFALVLQNLDDGAGPEDALARVVRDVLAMTTGRLNLLLTDGSEVHGTRVGNSLVHRESRAGVGADRRRRRDGPTSRTTRSSR